MGEFWKGRDIEPEDVKEWLDATRNDPPADIKEQTAIRTGKGDRVLSWDGKEGDPHTLEVADALREARGLDDRTGRLKVCPIHGRTAIYLQGAT